METKTAKAVAKFVRTSPRKARYAIDLIRGKNVADAFAILKFTPVRSADAIAKVLKSAVANAEHNYDMNTGNLYVQACYVDQGPSLRRVMPRGMGRADVIRRRMSHITVVVAERPEKPEPATKKEQAETKAGAKEG